jgi:hypothetical protein
MLAPLAIGIAHAIYTTLPVLDPGSTFWANDEGRFIEAGRAIFDRDVRYELFRLLVRFYYLFSDNPFLIVALHKVILLVVFIAVFQRRLLVERGAVVFGLVFATFLYLNSYFLRDTIVFEVTLLAIVLAVDIPPVEFPSGILTLVSAIRSTFSLQSAKSAAVLLPLVFLRPQNLLFFMRPWMSVPLVIAFLVCFRWWFAELHLELPWYLVPLEKSFWSKGVAVVITTLSNLNPIIKFPFFFERGLYLDYVLLLFGSVALFSVFIQLSLSTFRDEFKFRNFADVRTGLICLLVLYAALAVAADIRIFFAATCPFIIRVHRSLLGWGGLAVIVSIWLLMTVVRYFLDS